MNSTNKPLIKGIVSPPRTVPPHIVKPPYAQTGEVNRHGNKSPLSDKALERMRETCRAARRILDMALATVHPGVTTDHIDAMVHDACIEAGGYPSPLNYSHFPKSVCTSVNEVICHGIPDTRPLQEGDIVNVDITLFRNGVHGDCSAMVAVGEIDDQSKRLLRTAHECLYRGIAAVHPGGRIRDIGRAVERHARSNGFSVVRAYCGHGIGSFFHNSLMIPHNYDPKATTRIRPGMAFTIEPMINAGTWTHKLWDDGWTAVTSDGKRSAQYEHTILVREDGVEILTIAEGEKQPFLESV